MFVASFKVPEKVAKHTHCSIDARDGRSAEVERRRTKVKIAALMHKRERHRR